MKEFNVLEYEWGEKRTYNVYPTFVKAWNNKNYNFYSDQVKNIEDLKNWIKRVSMYHFWAKCEHEFLMANWPFGSKTMMDELKNIDFQDESIGNHIKTSNIITSDMRKIDKHEQIMMNIDILTEMLAKEFNIT